MRLSSDKNPRKLAQATVLLIAAALTVIGIAGLAASAKAGPVSFKVDNARISMGAFQDSTVIPATSTFPSESLPAPQRTDIELLGTETDGALSFPAAANTGLQFPYMNVPHPLEDLLIPFTMRLNEPGLTGTYDPASGAANLSGSVDIIVITGTGANFPLPDGLVDAAIPPLNLFARCRVPDVPVEFSTGTTFPFNADPFRDGFGVNGSIATAWSTLPDAVSENGGDCELLPVVTNGSGGIWFSNGIVEPEPQPPNPTFCEIEPDSPLCPAAGLVDISAARITPKKRVLKAGKSARLKIRLTNSGNADATGIKVRIRSSNRRVKTRRTMVMDVPAGSAAVKAFRVRALRGAQGRSKITVKAAGNKAVANLRIKKLKRSAKGNGTKPR